MYAMGENSAISSPNLDYTRQRPSTLKHLMVQDIFMTETVWFTDVILPARALPEKTGTFTNTNHRVQLGHQVVATPGAALLDL